MKKIISFSLFGTDKIYLQGAIENIKLSEIYKGWTTRFYIAEDCPALKTIEYMGAEVFVMPPMGTIDKTTKGWEESPNHKGMMTRFLPLSDPNVERMVSRDADARLCLRDYDAIQQWEESGMLGQVIYECDAHHNGVMGGCFGSVCGLHGDMNSLIDDFIEHYEERYPGQRWVFLDILFCRDALIGPICFSTLFQGHGTNNPLRVPMTPGMGRFICDVFDPGGWRGITWKPEQN